MRNNIRFALDEFFEDQCNWRTCKDCIEFESEDYPNICMNCYNEVYNISLERNFINYLIFTLKENEDLSQEELERLKFLYQIYKDAE